MWQVGDFKLIWKGSFWVTSFMVQCCSSKFILQTVELNVRSILPCFKTGVDLFFHDNSPNFITCCFWNKLCHQKDTTGKFLDSYHRCDNCSLTSLSHRPGFARLNLPYFMKEDCVDFVLDAVAMVAEHGWKLLPQVNNMWRVGGGAKDMLQEYLTERFLSFNVFS